MPPAKIRAVLLDAHGTLLELEPPAPALRAELAERFGVAITVEQAEVAIAAEIGYYRAHLHEGCDEEDVEALRRRCAQVLRMALPAEHRGALDLDELTGALLASLRFWPYPEVPDVLGELRARGLRLVVASNWDASLPHTLRALGLLEQLDAVVASATCAAPKPAPAVFERALELAGAAPGQAILVGDSPEEDVAGARAAGIEPVLILRDGRAPVPGVRGVATLRELLALPELAI